MQLANEVKDVSAFGSVVHKLPGKPKSQAFGCIVESTTMTLFDGGIQTQEDDKQCFGCCATTYRAHKHGRCKGSSDTPCTPHTARSSSSHHPCIPIYPPARLPDPRHPSPAVHALPNHRSIKLVPKHKIIGVDVLSTSSGCGCCVRSVVHFQLKPSEKTSGFFSMGNNDLYIRHYVGPRR